MENKEKSTFNGQEMKYMKQLNNMDMNEYKEHNYECMELATTYNAIFDQYETHRNLCNVAQNKLNSSSIEN